MSSDIVCLHINNGLKSAMSTIRVSNDEQPMEVSESSTNLGITNSTIGSLSVNGSTSPTSSTSSVAVNGTNAGTSFASSSVSSAASSSSSTASTYSGSDDDNLKEPRADQLTNVTETTKIKNRKRSRKPEKVSRLKPDLEPVVQHAALLTSLKCPECTNQPNFATIYEFLQHMRFSHKCYANAIQEVADSAAAAAAAATMQQQQRQQLDNLNNNNNNNFEANELNNNLEKNFNQNSTPTKKRPFANSESIEASDCQKIAKVERYHDDGEDGDDERIGCDSCDFQCDNHESLIVHRMTHMTSSPLSSPSASSTTSASLPLAKATAMATTVTTPAKSTSSYDFADISSIVATSANVTAIKSEPSVTSMLLHDDYENDEIESADEFQLRFRRMKSLGKFPCQSCDRVFPNLRAVKGHNKQHLEDPGHVGLYSCNMCRFKATDKQSVYRHSRDHIGDKPYECGLCSFSFTTKANCERHIRNRHSKTQKEEIKINIVYHKSRDPSVEQLDRSAIDNSGNIMNEIEQPTLGQLIVPQQTPYFNPMYASEPERPHHNTHQAIKPQQPQSPSAAISPIASLPIPAATAVVVAAAAARAAAIQRPATSLTSIAQPLPPPQQPQQSFHHQKIDEKPLDLRLPIKKEQDETDADMDDQPHSELDTTDNKELKYALEQQQQQQQQELIAAAAAFHAAATANGTVPPLNQLFLQNYLNVILASNVRSTISPSLVVPVSPPSSLSPTTRTTTATTATLAPPTTFTLPQSSPAFPLTNLSSAFFNSSLAPSGLDLIEAKERWIQLMSQKEVAGNQNNLLPGLLSQTLPSQQPQQLPPLTTTQLSHLTASNIMQPQEQFVNRKLPMPKSLTTTTITTSGSSGSMPPVTAMASGAAAAALIKPKQKQRRYRTEKPHDCEICDSRFTLKSNMERHLKHQHTEYWEQRKLAKEANLHYNHNQNLSTLRTEFKRGKPKLQLTANMPPKHLPETISPRTNSQQSFSKSAAIAELKRTTDANNFETNQTINESLLEQNLNHLRYLQEQQLKLSKMDTSISNKSTISAAGTGTQTREDAVKTEIRNHCSDNEADIEEDEDDDLVEDSDGVERDGNFTGFGNDGDDEDEDDDDEPMNENRNRDEYEYDDDDDDDDVDVDVDVDDLDGDEEEPGLVASCSYSDSSSSRSDSDDNKSENDETAKKRQHRRHRRRHGHGHRPNKTSAYSTAPNRLQCSFCNRIFPWSSSLHRHILTHTGQKPFKCPKCELLFTTKSNCDRHLIRKHERKSSTDVKSSSSDRKLFKKKQRISNNYANCEKSGGRGGDERREQNHGLLRNVPERPFKCSYCPSSTFSTMINLQKHICSKHIPNDQKFGQSDGNQSDEDDEQHTTPTTTTAPQPQPQPPQSQSIIDLPFKCHICDKSYSENIETLEHIRAEHKSEYEFLKSKYGGSDDLQSILNGIGAIDQHNHNHATGSSIVDEQKEKFPDYVNRKIICSLCLKRFWSAEDLRRHMRTHTGQKPFSCDICHQRFSLKHSMLRHRKNHRINTNQSLPLPLQRLTATGQQSNASAAAAAAAAFYWSSYQSIIPTAAAPATNHQNAKRTDSDDSDDYHQQQNSSTAAIIYPRPSTSTSLTNNNTNYTNNNNNRNENRSPAVVDCTLKSTDLIGSLLGINDRQLIDRALVSTADDAAKILGIQTN